PTSPPSPLSLHAALPLCRRDPPPRVLGPTPPAWSGHRTAGLWVDLRDQPRPAGRALRRPPRPARDLRREPPPHERCRRGGRRPRSEEHTSELQSRENLVC